MTPTAAPSATTERARALVADRTAEAPALGRRGGRPRRTTRRASSPRCAPASTALADPEYLAGPAPRRARASARSSASASRCSHAVTRRPPRRDPPRPRRRALLDVAGHLVREPLLELHWLALRPPRADDRRRPGAHLAAGPRRGPAAPRTGSRVDTLAHVAGRGILAEPYRWAELEQLVYSPSRWERRLAGSTIATIPHVDRDRRPHARGRPPRPGHRRRPHRRRGAGRPEGALVGPAVPAPRGPAGDGRLPARARPRVARDTDDGHRAWVIRDALREAARRRSRRSCGTPLAGIRRRPGAPSTSRAAATAADFLAYGLAVPPAERPIIDRT